MDRYNTHPESAQEKDLTGITATEIASRLWDLVMTEPRKTSGRVGSQRLAFRLLLNIHGGAGFIASQPKAKLSQLAHRGICASNLRAILRQMAGLVLKRSRGLIKESAFRIEMRRLMRDAEGPGRTSIAEDLKSRKER